MREIADLYRELCKAPSDINEHLPAFGHFVAEVGQDFRGRAPDAHFGACKVIELGVRHGVSTIAWLHALSSVEGGHLWSVDRSFPGDDAPIRQVNVQPDRWTFVLGDDLGKHTLEALPDLVDIVFIDTAHTLAHTYRELCTYGLRVRPGGVILLHDTLENAVETGYPVRTAIDRFVSLHSLPPWTHRPWNNGLGIIQIDRALAGERP